MSTFPVTPFVFLLSFGLISGIGIGFSGMFPCNRGYLLVPGKKGFCHVYRLDGSRYRRLRAGNVLNKIITVTGDMADGLALYYRYLYYHSFVTLLFVVNSRKILDNPRWQRLTAKKGKMDPKKKFSGSIKRWLIAVSLTL
jgi:hypothetical protein